MSREYNGDEFTRPSIPMVGVLAFLCGFGLFYSYWKFFTRMWDWTPLDRVLFVGVAAGLGLWGLKQILHTLFQSATGRPMQWPTLASDSKLSGPSETPGTTRPGIVPIVSGVLIAILGLTILMVLPWAIQRAIPLAIIIVLGLLLAGQGLRELIATWLAVLPESRPKPRVALPRPGLVYLLIMAVLFVGSLLARQNMPMLVFSLMAGPFVLNGWIIFMMFKRTNLTRHVPRRAFAGEPFSVDIRFENRKWWFASSFVTASDCIQNAHERLRAHVLFPRVRAGQHTTASYKICLMQRGTYRFGPIDLSSRFPLGLVERGLTFEQPGKILVYPRIGRLSAAWKRKRSIAAELFQRPDSQRGVFYDEFHGIREFRHGDNPRAIHWRTSARHNELMVREFDRSCGQDLMVLLDLWRPEQPASTDLERVELAISFAATICVEHMRQTLGARLFVAVSGADWNCWEGQTGSSRTESLMEILALVEAGCNPDVKRLIGHLATLRPGTTQTLLLTTRRQQQVDDLFRNKDRRKVDGGVAVCDVKTEVIAVNRRELAAVFVLD